MTDQQKGDVNGDGVLAISLRHPTAAFLYRATRPRVLIDDVDANIPDWGSYRIPVTPGTDHVAVWVPYAVPRRAGRANTSVAVGAGREVQLEYMAPSITFASGSIGSPGEQKSAGFSLVMVLNLLALLVVVVGCVIFAAR